jgi:hypothetical protein
MRSTAVAIRPEFKLKRKKQFASPQIENREVSDYFSKTRAVDFTKMRERLPLIHVVQYSKEDSEDAEQHEIDIYLRAQKRPSSKVKTGSFSSRSSFARLCENPAATRFKQVQRSTHVASVSF